MLKITDVDSNEYRIYHELLRSGSLFRDEARGVLPPVAILETPYRFAIVVMPRFVGSFDYSCYVDLPASKVGN